MRTNLIQVIDLLDLLSSELDEGQNRRRVTIPKILGSSRNIGNGYWKNWIEGAEALLLSLALDPKLFHPGFERGGF